VNITSHTADVEVRKNRGDILELLQWRGSGALDSCFASEPTLSPVEEVERQMQRRLGSRVRDLRVIVREDGMILQGRALSFYAKQLAQHAAMELAEIPILANNIQVK
jgi:hypothetical protein